MLSIILEGSCVVHLLWVVKEPHKHFPAHVVNALLCMPERVCIWDTAELGRPDMVKLTVQMYRDTNSEVVIITSNPKGTRTLMEGCRAEGVPAHGPTWDS